MSASSATAMLQCWKSFDLTNFQRGLDQTATDIAGRQDASELSRQQLVAQMKLFKKNQSAEVVRTVTPLMKVFRMEIDALTKRSTACEAEFLNLYKKLIELPDPSLTLEQAEVHQKKNYRLNDVEIENSKLRETLADYNKEFAEVKNQEVTIKNLKEKIKELERDSMSNAQKIIDESKKDLMREFTAKEKTLLDQQLQAATKLSEAESRARSLEAALEASQSDFFNFKVKFDEENEAKQAEIELLVSDLDRANQSNEHAQKENDALRDELSSLQENMLQQGDNSQSSMEASFKEMSQSNLEHELASKEREVQQLVEDVQRLQGSLLKLRESSGSQISKLEEEVESKKFELTDLKTLLDSKSDYDEVKRELGIIKSTEFSGLTNNSNKPLEVLLLEKNRVLQDENTALRTSSIQLKEHCSVIQERLVAAESDQVQSAALVKRLEEDLMVVQTPTVRSAADGSATLPSGSTPSNASHELIADALNVGTDVEGSNKNDSSMLVIVTSQRERFRLHNNELQAENYTLQQNIQQLQNDIDRMRGDNVKLYEKIKYLENYSPSTRIVMGDDITTKRYSNQYEDNIDPFTSFSRKEKQRKYMNLSPPEKMTLGISRMILSSKLGRTIFFFYMLFMHFLLYIILYKYAYVDDCKHHIADLCYQKFGAQMAPNND